MFGFFRFDYKFVKKHYSGKCGCKDIVTNEMLLKYLILVRDLKWESYFIHCDQLSDFKYVQSNVNTL